MTWFIPRQRPNTDDSAGKRTGFSLLESLFAAFVVAVGILAVFGSLSYGLRGSQVATRQVEALFYARRIFDLVRIRNLAYQSFPALPNSASGVADPPGSPRPLNDPPFALDLPASTGLERHVTCERVSTDLNSYEYELMCITVTVSYTEQGHRRQIQLKGTQARP